MQKTLIISATSRSTQPCKIASQQQRAQCVLYFYKLIFVTEFQRLGNHIRSCKSDARWNSVTSKIITNKWANSRLYQNGVSSNFKKLIWERTLSFECHRTALEEFSFLLSSVILIFLSEFNPYFIHFCASIYLCNFLVSFCHASIPLVFLSSILI